MGRKSVAAPDRIPCAVPFCRRTAAREKHPHATWIICGKHWRLASKRKRRLYGLMCRRYDHAQLQQRSDAYAWRKWRQLVRLEQAIKAECITAAGAMP